MGGANRRQDIMVSCSTCGPYGDLVQLISPPKELPQVQSTFLANILCVVSGQTRLTLKNIWMRYYLALITNEGGGNFQNRKPAFTFNQRGRSYYVRESITVQLTSCFIRLDSTKQVNLFLMFMQQCNLIQSRQTGGSRCT